MTASTGGEVEGAARQRGTYLWDVEANEYLGEVMATVSLSAQPRTAPSQLACAGVGNGEPASLMYPDGRPSFSLPLTRLAVCGKRWAKATPYQPLHLSPATGSLYLQCIVIVSLQDPLQHDQAAGLRWRTLLGCVVASWPLRTNMGRLREGVAQPTSHSVA